ASRPETASLTTFDTAAGALLSPPSACQISWFCVYCTGCLLSFPPQAANDALTQSSMDNRVLFTMALLAIKLDFKMRKRWRAMRMVIDCCTAFLPFPLWLVRGGGFFGCADAEINYSNAGEEYLLCRMLVKLINACRIVGPNENGTAWRCRFAVRVTYSE